MDAASVVALLAALVPLALFWALLHHRGRARGRPARTTGPTPDAARPQASAHAGEAKPATDDVGRDDVGGGGHPVPQPGETTTTGGATAAAAGGALVLGYDLARRAEEQSDDDAAGQADR